METSSHSAQHIVKDVIITKEIKEKENNIFRVLLCLSENLNLACRGIQEELN